MQETQYIDDLEGTPKRRQEIFIAESEAAVLTEMQDRLKGLEDQGHKLVRREPITHRQALKVAVTQALHGDQRLLTKFKRIRHHRSGHR